MTAKRLDSLLPSSHMSVHCLHAKIVRQNNNLQVISPLFVLNIIKQQDKRQKVLNNVSFVRLQETVVKMTEILPNGWHCLHVQTSNFSYTLR